MGNDLLKEILNEELLDSIYNSIVITSGKLEGPEHPKILFANKSFERMTGYTKEEAIGKTPRILQGEKTDRDVLDRLKSTLQKGEFFEGNTINYRKDGTPYHLEWNITPIKDDAGTTQYYFCVQKDVSKSIKYKLELEKRVNEEVQKVKAQQEFIHKQSKQAAMGEMIDAIAHQWMNPLCKIRMKEQMIQFFLEEKNIHDEEVEQYLQDSINLTYHMEETLREFRSFLRPNESIETIPLNKIIQGVLLLLKDELLSNFIETKIISIDNLNVELNENEFKHVLINLISNSKDAFNQNKIENRHITFEGDSTKDTITLKIFDNAGGIPEDLIDKIFEQHVTGKKDIGGTGIGLYLTKQILEKHNIGIEVVNIDKGACFTLTFKKGNS